MDSRFILHTFKDTLFNSLSITALVMVMLLLVEFVNVSSSGKAMARLRNKPLFQIIVAALLGLIPGCIGGFAIVSLFTHKLLSFGALVAGMITGFGDEAFVLFAISPQWTFILIACLLPIGMVAGFITYLFSKKREFVKSGHTLELHHECDSHDLRNEKTRLSIRNLKNISFHRAVLVFGLALYLFFLVSGSFSHNHAALPNVAGFGLEQHNHKQCDHEHSHAAHDHGILSWENIIFILLAAVTLVIVAFSSEHFLVSHLWEHVIKQHFLSIFAWTFGILLFLHVLLYFVDINAIVADHQWAMLAILVLALFVGIIPESGPHLIFVVLFFNGTIPFSILLANSIVQDGHSTLPLLAESRKNFFLMKAINMFVGLVVGLAGYLLHF
ncbi:MAG: putative manganese transporter [Bacteroidales bacterium]|jgi:hypothetical protein|nr:putative manganese transporter [Bacteroidales bacterium]